MDKLKELLSLCKCGVFLTVDYHRGLYQNADVYLRDLIERDPDLANEIPGEVLKKMVETDTVIDLNFYPETPIGSYQVYHYDLDGALDRALAIMKRES